MCPSVINHVYQCPPCLYSEKNWICNCCKIHHLHHSHIMIYDATDRGSVEVPMMYVDDIDTSADAAPSVPEIETSVTDPSV